MNKQIGLSKAGKKLVLGFEYSPQKVEEIKLLGKSNYDPVTKTRSYSLYYAPKLVDFCNKHNLPIDEDVYEVLSELDRLPELEMYHEGLRLRVGPGPTLPEEILQNRSGEWIQIPAIHAKKAYSWCKKNKKRISVEVESYIKNYFSQETKNYQLGGALSANPIPITGLTSTLLPEQWVPAEAIRTNRKIILADEQGLGKTIESLVAARIKGEEAQRIIVVCPDRMAETWCEETKIHFEPGTFSPWIALSRTPQPIPDEVDMVVIGWAIVGYWSDHLNKWKPDMIIADEGHYAKAGKLVTKKEQVWEQDEQGSSTIVEKVKKVGGTQRSSAIIQMLSNLDEKGKALILTGTPTPSRPLELLALLQALQIEGFFGGSQLFKIRYCDGKQKYIGAGRGINRSGYVWDFSGASNLVELNTQLLSSGHYIRRTKKHLVDTGRLPKKIVDGVEFYDINEKPQPLIIRGDPDVMEQYVTLEYGLSRELAEKAHKYAASMGLSVTNQKVLRKVLSDTERRKESIFKLRKLSGMAAIPSVIAKAQEYLDRGEKVIIVAHHRDIVDAYCDAFEGAVKIQGAMSPKKVEEAKALFNSPGFDHPVLVLALEAGKTGHTLCKQPDKTCAVAIFGEPAWNPSDAHQAQDRIWRIGQNRVVKIINVLPEDTVAIDIYNKCQEKRKVVDTAVDGIVAEDDSEKSLLRDMTKELLTKGLQESC